MNAPVIETERLVLRPFRRTDVAAMLRIWSDPRTLRWFDRPPMQEDEIWTRVTRALGHWQLMGHGYWAVADRADDAAIGEVGFADFRRGIPELDSPFEAGWAIDPDRHGEGLGTEAVAAAHRWLDDMRGGPRSQCLIHPGNRASLALAARMGYGNASPVRWRGGEQLLLERPGTDPD